MALQAVWFNRRISETLRDTFKVSGEAINNYPLIIECIGHNTERIIANVEKNKGNISREIGLIHGLAVEVPLAALPEIAGLIGVVKIWEDTPVQIRIDKMVPYIGESHIQESGYSGRGIVIAVLDTGIFPHEDLINPENRILAWCDLVQGRREPYDDHGHGTYVTGIIAGNGYSSDGKIQGVAPETRIVGLKVINRDGTGKLSDLIAGIEWCLSRLNTLNIKIINLSLGTKAQADYNNDLLCRITTQAVRQGIIICSAGNDNVFSENKTNSPGINPNIITVGNYDTRKTFVGEDIINFQNAVIKNFYARPDIVAPSAPITSLNIDGEYSAFIGASPATALVSGTVALIMQKWPNLKPEQVKWLIQKNAQNLGVGKELQGAGMLNLDNIFGSKQRQITRIEKPNNLFDQLLKVIIQIIGRSLVDSGTIGEMFPNILKSLINRF